MSRPPLPLWLAALVVAAAGVCIRLAFPAPALWIAAPMGVALWLLALRGRGFWLGLTLSLVGSLAFWLSLIHWLTLYLGPLPWAALAGLMAIYQAVAGGMIAWLMRWTPRLWPSDVGRLVLLPALIASLWIGREMFAAAWPYGGFSWGRLAMSQTNGPFAPLLSWLGPNGVGWVLVALSAVALELLCSRAKSPRFRVSRGSEGWLRYAAIVAVLLALPLWKLPVTGETRVLAVQGGADASLFTTLSPGAVLKAQADATLAFRGEQVDAIIWPENGADIDPTRSRASAGVLNTISREFSAPMLVGAITERDDEFFNSSLLWSYPDGLVDWYDKAHPVPFAEYMPDRAFWRPFAPDLIDLIGRDYHIGVRPNVLSVAGSLAGVAICFDIAYDNLTAEMMRGGAQYIVAQTNNADFGHTDESAQQQAIARMRAFETGRSVVNISTVSGSAIIDPDGHLAQTLPVWQPGGMLGDVTLVSGSTPASSIGPSLSTLMAGFALLGSALVAGLVLRGSYSRSESPRRARNQSSRS